MPKNPKKREKCENCGKMFKHLFKYKGRCKEWEGKKLCKLCFKKVPRNPFFVYVKDRPSSRITSFTLSLTEKKLMHSKFMGQGCSYDRAWHKVNIICYQMRLAKMRKTKAFRKQQVEKRELETQDVKFKESFVTLR